MNFKEIGDKEIEKRMKSEEQLSRKIMNLISPLLNGLDYSQIECLLENLRNKILHFTSFHQDS